MSAPGHFSREARGLAHRLVEEKRLTLRQLQQGVEWCSRNNEALLTFLNRFCSLQLDEEQLGLVESEEDGGRRRLFARYQTSSRLWIEILGKLVEVSTLNVSRGGLAFQSRWSFEVGSSVLVGQGDPVAALVRYCYCVQDSEELATIGAEFAPETVDDLLAIEALMASLTTRLVV